MSMSLFSETQKDYMKKIKSITDWIYSIRNIIYILGITALIMTVFVKCIRSENQAFLPPDLVPHPIPPWDDPRNPQPRPISEVEIDK